MSRRRRHIVAALLLLALLAALRFFDQLLLIAMQPANLYSGLILLLLCLCLGLLNVRKKLPMLDVGKASAWLNAHIFFGLLALGVFVIHVGLPWPMGLLEQVLAILFLAVSASGLVGWWASRTLPAQMVRSGEELVFERIPVYQRQLTERADALVLMAEKETASSAVSDFYFSSLKAFLLRRPGPFFIWAGSKRDFHRLERAFRSHRRYLNDVEEGYFDQLEDLVTTKQNLDFQWSAQRFLRGWLFLHIPLAVSTLLVASFHGWQALRFVGGF